MDYQDPYVDINGLNYKGLSKKESLALYESFINDKNPLMLCDLDLQLYMRNDGKIGYIWHPCIAIEFILDEDEVSRLYPRY